jgi:hypothetical protein
VAVGADHNFIADDRDLPTPDQMLAAICNRRGRRSGAGDDQAIVDSQPHPFDR